MSLWDDRFVGWPHYSEHPTCKQDIEEFVAQQFRVSRPTLRSSGIPRPESIVIIGDVAITYYYWPQTDKSTPLKYRITHVA